MIINVGPYRRSKLPVLDGNYPANKTVKFPAGGSTSATFKVRIAEDGKPAVYTYQWYVNGEPITGATESSYTMTGLNANAEYTVYCAVTNKAGTINTRLAILTVHQIFTKAWTGSSDMDFYYGDGSDQEKTTNVGVFNDLSTRYGQVLWFTMDQYGGKGFTLNWNPKAFAGYIQTVYCRISKTGADSNGKWPGCNNTADDIHYTKTSDGYQFRDDNFVFEPGVKYYIYINRSWTGDTVTEGYGIHYYAQGSPATYGTSDITIH